MNKIQLIVFIALSFLGCKNEQNKNLSSKKVIEPTGVENVAYKWGEMALTATANDTERFQPRPTITSRYLGLIAVAVFDAWSRYDKKAIPVYLNNVERTADSEHSLKNKEIAISYAAFRTMNEYYHSDKALFASFMTTLGLDPNNEV